MNATSHAHANERFESYRQTGNPDDLTAVFDLVSPELLALGAHMATDAAQAEDLVQETFLEAIRTAQRWDLRRPVMPWLTGILVHKAQSARRRAQRSPDPTRLHEPSAPDGLDVAQQRELRHEIRKAIQGLPEQDAQLLIELFDHDSRPRDLAAAAGVSPGTMRVRIHRAVERLRFLLPASLALGGGAILGPLAGVRGSTAVRKVIHQAATAGAAARHTGALEASALKAGAGLFATPTTPLLVAMTSKTLLALGAAALVAAGLWLLPKGDTSRDGVLSLEQQHTQDVDLDPLASLAVEAATPSSRRLSQDAVESDPKDSLPPEPIPIQNGPRLVLHITGIEAPLDDPMVFHVERRKKARGQTIATPVSRNGPLEIDVSSLFEDRGAMAGDRLVVRSRHVDYMGGASHVLFAEDEGAKPEFSQEFEVTPIGARLRGTLVLPETFEVSDRRVGFWPEGSAPDPDDPLSGLIPNTTTDAMGSFEFPFSTPGKGTLFAIVPGLRTLNVEVEFGRHREVDLGLLEMDRGAEIGGTALFDGQPTGPGIKVTATAHGGLVDSFCSVHDVQVIDGKTIHQRSSAATDPQGHFKIHGLEPGVSYHLTIADPKIDKRVYQSSSIGRAGLPFVAPREGIELDTGLVPASLRFESGGRPVPRARVRLQFPPGFTPGPSPPLSQYTYRAWRKTDREGHLYLAIPMQPPFLEIECKAEGFEPRLLQIQPSLLDAEAKLVVELSRSASLAAAGVQLDVELHGEGVETLEGHQFSLWLTDQESDEHSTHEQRLSGGRLLFTGLPSGDLIGTLYGPRTQELDPKSIPCAKLERTPKIRLAALPRNSDGVHRMRHGVELGGRIELHLVGFDGAHAPAEFKLIKANGSSSSASVVGHKPNGKRTERLDHCKGAGPFWIDTILDPGTWVLGQVGAAYAETQVGVEVQRGETTVITFQLEPR